MRTARMPVSVLNVSTEFLQPPCRTCYCLAGSGLFWSLLSSSIVVSLVLQYLVSLFLSAKFKHSLTHSSFPNHSTPHVYPSYLLHAPLYATRRTRSYRWAMLRPHSLSLRTSNGQTGEKTVKITPGEEERYSC
jgi:hypothetical protein